MKVEEGKKCIWQAKRATGVCGDDGLQTEIPVCVNFEEQKCNAKVQGLLGN